MKKRLVSVLLVSVLVLGLTACGGSKKEEKKEEGGDSGDKITVLLPNHEMDTVGFYEEQTRKFEEETGIKVELINMGWDNVADRVTAEMSSGGSSYDVIEFDNSWVAKFAENDWVEPLNDYITDDMKAGIVPGLLDKFTFDDQLYGVVWNNDTRFFMYNKAKLEAAGIKEPAKTWDELIEQSKTLKDAGETNYGYIDSYMQAQSGCNEFVQLVYSFGGEFFDESGKPIIATDPGVKKAYEYMVKAYKEGVFDPTALTADYETVANTFYSGTTAFFIQAWPGIYSSANDAEVSTIVDQVEVADYAVSGDGNTQCVLTLPEAMAIPKTSKNKEAAWKYIEYMSSKEFDKLKAETIGALPVWTELFSDSTLLEKYPYWEQFGKQSEFSRGLPDLLWFDEFSNILQVETINIIQGSVSVEEGLAGMQEQFEAAMK